MWQDLVTPVAPVCTQYSSGGEPQVLVATTVMLNAALTNSGMQRCAVPRSSVHSSIAARTHTATQLQATRARIKLGIFQSSPSSFLGQKISARLRHQLSLNSSKVCGNFPKITNWFPTIKNQTHQVKTCGNLEQRLRVRSRPRPELVSRLSWCVRVSARASALCVRRHAPTPAGKDGTPDYTQSATAQVWGGHSGHFRVSSNKTWEKLFQNPNVELIQCFSLIKPPVAPVTSGIKV